MPLARLGDSLVFFAHIPKTGGTSVETYLRAKGPVTMHHNRSHDWLPCSPQHMHAALYSVLFDAAFFNHSFAVLRDPLARLQSEYRHRAKRAADQGKAPAAFDDWAPRILKLSRNRPYLYDNHVRPQIDFVSPGMQLFRLEDGLDRVFDWIDDISGDAAAAPRQWKRDLSHVDVPSSAETKACIRNFYAEDYGLLAQLSDT